MKCFIIDIDGTIADGSHRLPHIQKQPKDWDTYFDAASGDAPIEHMRMVVSSLWEMHDIVYVTGRVEHTRTATTTWLAKHNFMPAKLYMRPDGDHRDDHILKIELLAQIRADGYEPIMAFDDRTRVVKAWREAGIPCAQVAEGDF